MRFQVYLRSAISFIESATCWSCFSVNECTSSRNSPALLKKIALFSSVALLPILAQAQSATIPDGSELTDYVTTATAVAAAAIALFVAYRGVRFVIKFMK